MEEIELMPLEENDIERFVKDNQEAFHFGALEEFGFLCESLQHSHRWIL